MSCENLSEVKSELVKLMKREDRITVKDAAGRLDLAISTVRQHLLGLENEGLIGSADRRQGVGRPQKVYFLTEKGDGLFPGRDREVLPRLLEFLAEEGRGDQLERFFYSFCGEDIQDWKYQIRGRSREERMANLLQYLERSGYAPELSHDDQGRCHLALYHCPYESVLAVTQVPCECKRKAMAEILETDVEHRQSIAMGASSCRFVLDWSQ